MEEARCATGNMAVHVGPGKPGPCVDSTHSMKLRGDSLSHRQGSQGFNACQVAERWRAPESHGWRFAGSPSFAPLSWQCSGKMDLLRRSGCHGLLELLLHGLSGLSDHRPWIHSGPGPWARVPCRMPGGGEQPRRCIPEHLPCSSWLKAWCDAVV